MLTARERYVIEMAPTAWDDGGIPVEPGDSPWEAANWMQKLLFIAAVPLRRELFQDWFEVVVRYGRTGGEEAFYIYDPTASKIEFPMRPTRDGELFVFVNDAVIGLPLLYDRLYRNNHGSAKIFVTLKKKTERQSGAPHCNTTQCITLQCIPLVMLGALFSCGSIAPPDREKRQARFSVQRDIAAKTCCPGSDTMTSMFRRSVLACAAVLAFAGIGQASAQEKLKSYKSDTKEFWTNPPPDWFLGDETEAQKVWRRRPARRPASPMPNWRRR